MLKEKTSRMMKSTMLASFAMAGVVFAPSVFAQAAASDEKVTVTGTRIKQKNLTSNSPIATVTSTYYNQSSGSNVEDVLGQLPQFVPDIGKTTNNGGGGYAFLNLRGLGTTRTLTLVNGKRYTPGLISGAVDVNAIPSAMIDRVEVVTGGASAVYGADAVAGVVNFILKDNFEGISMNAEYGYSAIEEDAKTKSLSVIMGTNSADGRGNVTLYGSYYNQDPVFRSARSISSPDFASPTTHWGRIDGFGNTPASFVTQINTLFTGYGGAGNQIPNVSPFTIGVNSDGTLWSFGSGPAAPATDRVIFNRRDNFVTPQDGCNNNTFGVPPCLYDISGTNFLIVPTERYALGAGGHYQIDGDRLVGFANVDFMHFTNAFALAPNPVTGIRVPVHAAFNSFVSPDLRSLLDARDGTLGRQGGVGPAALEDDVIIMRRRFQELGPRTSVTENFAYNVTGGFRGELPSFNGDWEVFAAYQRNDAFTVQSGLVDAAKLADALGSPRIGTTLYAGSQQFGQAPCASGNPACVPINIFSSNSISPGAAAYISTSSQADVSLQQSQAGANVSGELFDLFGAGAWSFAVGAEYRYTFLDQIPDVNLVPQDPTDPSSCKTNGLNCVADITASQDVYEAFGELRVPLLSGLSMAEEVALEFGYRISDYNTSGITHTYKIGGEWAFNDSVRARGMYNRAVRAPTVLNLFGPTNQDFPDVESNGSDDFCSQNSKYGPPVGAIAALCAAQGVVNTATFQSTQSQWQAFNTADPNVKPETADTFTAGIVIQGRDWFPNFTASLDWYSVEVTGLINIPDVTSLAASCVANPVLANPDCAAFNRDPGVGGGEIEFVTARTRNVGSLKQDGLDLAMSYRMGVGMLGLPDNWGDLAFNLFATKLLKFESEVFPGATPVADLIGVTGDPAQVGTGIGTNPEWRVNLRTAYNVGNFDFVSGIRYLSSVEDFGNAGNPTGSYTYLDLEAGYQVAEWMRVYVQVANATDKEPPFLASAFNANTDGSTYDVQGRYFTFGVKTDF